MNTAAAQYRAVQRSAATDCVTQHADLVRRIAHHLAARLPASVEVDDLIQAGMMGLIEASRSYDADQGASFETYASIRIRGSMIDEIRRGDWVPRSVHRRARQAAATVREIEQRTGRAAIATEVASAMEMPLPEYLRLMEDAARGQVLSLESHIDDHGEPNTTRTGGPSPQQHLERSEFRQQLVKCIGQLPEREQLVLSMYYEQELNLREIGEVTRAGGAETVIAIFAGMRRMAELLTKQGHQVRYFRLGDKDNRQNFAENLQQVFKATKATRFEYQEPDEWRLDQDLRTFAAGCGLVTSCVSSEHFLDGRGGVAAHFKKDAKRWLMESYYRRMRVSTRLLMDEDGTPAGGEWNYDSENRKPPPNEPLLIPQPLRFAPDAITREVIEFVQTRFADHPGDLKSFAWPVTRSDALRALDEDERTAFEIEMARDTEFRHLEQQSHPQRRLGLQQLAELIAEAEVGDRFGRQVDSHVAARLAQAVERQPHDLEVDRRGQLELGRHRQKVSGGQQRGGRFGLQPQ